MAEKCDFLIVGAGFAGAVCAERLASAGFQVVVVEKRSHIAGNAYDEYDADGILIHPYGPHIFHTNDKRVFDYLSAFTRWRFYEHRVRSVVEGKIYPIPINQTTINLLYGLELDESGIADFIEKVREHCHPVLTSEDVVLNSVGRDLCEKFYRGYTRKQWGMDLADLYPEVAARIPFRTNDDDRYFTDLYNYMPSEGFTRMFQKILDHPKIRLRLNTDYFDIKNYIKARHIIYSGPIDEFFNYCHSKLPYRSLQFTHRHIPDTERQQEVAVYNYPGVECPYTRSSEFKHITGQVHPGTSIVWENSTNQGDPYYPIPRSEHIEIYNQYESLAKKRKDVTFVGRLAQYRYYNMDQVVSEALRLIDEKLLNL